MITLAFSRPKRWTLLSWAIRRFTKSRVSHCLIGVTVHGIRMFLHCTAGGVKLTPRKKYERENDIVHEFPFRTDVSGPLVHAYQHLDDAYDYAGLFGFAWVIIAWRLFARRIRNPLANARAMWCSEFALHLNHEGLLVEFEGLDPELTHCQHLLDRIRPGEGSFGDDLARREG